MSCGLEAVDHQVECYLIRTFWLLKQVLKSPGHLFHKKNLSVSGTTSKG